MSAFNSEADVERVADALIDRSLPKAEWTHVAHFATALCLLRRRGVLAFEEMAPLIRAYNLSTGVENTDMSGYHETITVASLRAGYAWLRERPGHPLHLVLHELIESPFGRSSWLLSYWTRDLLFSARARREWVDPDLKPLPF